MPRFLYFDLGNVILKFDHHRSARQMGDVAGVPAERMQQVVFETDLEARYEAGALTDREFYETICRETGTQPDFQALLHAGAEIFTPNVSIIPVIGGLRGAGYRLGILSNTCSSHWAYCSGGRYKLLDRSFEVYALSYQIGCCKPAAEIFERAAALAGTKPSEIFYVDDTAGHVAVARAVGFDAVQYTTTEQLVGDLRDRGVEFNY